MAILTVEQKLNEIQKVLNEGEKKFGKGTYQVGSDKIIPTQIVCSTGSLSLDAAIGIGGYPRGRNIEVGGQESSGKTTLSLLAIAEVQRSGGLCFFCDAEQSYDPVYAARLGVDNKSLIKFQPDDAEMAYELVDDLASSNLVSFGVVDSTSTLIPRSEVAGEYGDAQMGLQARLLSQALRKLNPVIAKSGTTIYWISQIRSKIGGYGNPDVVGVGNAMRFYASVRIKTSKEDVQKTDEEGQESVIIKCHVFKNKVASPFKTGRFTLLTGVNGEYGLDTYQEILDYGVKYELINKAGAWYSCGEDRIGQGKENAKKWLKENNETFIRIKKTISEKLLTENFNDVDPNSFQATMDNITNELEKPKKSRRENKVVDKEEVIPDNVDVETSEIKEDISE